MTKIVYNACHGGFYLSDEAVFRFAEIKGMRLFPEPGLLHSAIFWTVPPESRTGILYGDDWRAASLDDRRASNAAHDAATLDVRRIPRNDPALVQVVEELGDAANTIASELKIIDLPAGTRYRIEEYDGFESVCTEDSYEWEVA